MKNLKQIMHIRFIYIYIIIYKVIVNTTKKTLLLYLKSMISLYNF
jgi:hypothetical protein